jgi:hypothetical protein
VSKFAPRGAPDRSQLEELARTGASLREIALALDRSIATVRYWLRRWEIPRADARRSAVDPSTAPREVMRACKHHGSTAWRLDRRGTYRCVRCAQERVAERRRRVKRILVEEAGGCCSACGYDDCCAALQFHHVDPSTKEFALSHEGTTGHRAGAAGGAEVCPPVRELSRGGGSRGPGASGSPGWIRTTKN